MNACAIELNAANFEQEVRGAIEPVLIEFWAGWSDACKAVARVIDTVVEDPSIPFKVCAVNVEKNELLTENCGVRTVPTLLLFNKNGLQGQIVGHTTEVELRRKLEGAYDTARIESRPDLAWRPREISAGSSHTRLVANSGSEGSP